MPTTTRHGTANAANTAIGGIPIIHYFDFKSRGRGQHVRLMLIDAGAAYVDIRYAFAEWPEVKKSDQLAGLNPTRNIPIIQLDGPVGPIILTQTYAIHRQWARTLGRYEGQTEDEKYWADAVCDIVADWRTEFITAFFSNNQEEDYAKHKQGSRANYLIALETKLKNSNLSRRGAFIIGTEITYADLVLYQILHDEGLTQSGQQGLASYPRLAQLVQAVEERPNIKAFMASDSYLG